MIYARAKRVGLVLSLLFVLGLIFNIGVQVSGAEPESGYTTQKFPMQYLEIDVPDNYIRLDTSLKDADPIWGQAEIPDAKNAKEEYEARGVVAAYFVPETHSYIY